MKKISTLVGVIIIIVAGFVFFGTALTYQYLLLQKAFSINKQSALTPAFKQTANCVNEKYGYELSYPDGWKVYTRGIGEATLSACSENLDLLMFSKDIFKTIPGEQINLKIFTRENQTGDFWQDINSLDDYIKRLSGWQEINTTTIDGERLVWLKNDKELLLVAFHNYNIYEFNIYGVDDITLSNFLASFKFITPIDPTADWELFTNADFGYFIKYPRELIVKEWAQIIKTGGPEGANNWLLSEVAFGKNGEFSSAQISITVSSRSILEEKERVKISVGDAAKNEEEIKIDGFGATKYVGKAGEGLTGKIVTILIPYKSRVYSLNYSEVNNKNDNLETFNRMISTFKFITSTNPAAEWKTYINTKYGFEIKYPQEGTVSEANYNEVDSMNSMLLIGKAVGDFYVSINIGIPSPVSEWMTKLNNKDPEIVSVSNFSINGINATKAEIDRGKGGIASTEYYIEKDGVGYNISALGIGIKDEDTSNKIIFTFKFVTTEELTSTWETYNNYGILFKYPKEIGNPVINQLSTKTDISFNNGIIFNIGTYYNQGLGRIKTFSEVIIEAMKNPGANYVNKRNIIVDGKNGTILYYTSKITDVLTTEIYIPIDSNGNILMTYGDNSTLKNIGGIGIFQILPTFKFTKALY